MSVKLGESQEKDTTIIEREETKCGKFDALYEKWSWEAVKAESLIFVTLDVKHLSEGELTEEVKVLPLYKDGDVTIKESESGFTFVNFNFTTS
jgi:hypothetical protein